MANPIELKNHVPCASLLKEGDPDFLRAHGAKRALVIGGQIFYLLESFIQRGDSYGVERIYQAGIDLLALYAQDREHLARFMPPNWEENFRKNLEAMYQLYQQQLAEHYRSEVVGRLKQSAMDEAEEAVSRILNLAQSVRLRDWFVCGAADRQTPEGMFECLVEIETKAAVPAIRERLLSAGVTEEMLARLPELRQAVHASRFARAVEAAAAPVESEQLRVSKGLVVAEIVQAATVARAEAPEGRRERYQQNRLLDLPPRAARAEEAAKPVQPAQPAKPAQPVQPAPAAGPTTPARPPLPGTDGVAPAKGDAPAPGPVRPAPVHLTAGMPLVTLPSRNGPSLTAMVEADGSIRWVVGGQGEELFKGAPAIAVHEPAPAKPAEPAAKPPEPAAKPAEAQPAPPAKRRRPR
jgi:hypothetical protein